MKTKRIFISAAALFAIFNTSIVSAFASDELIAQNDSIVIGSDFENGNAGNGCLLETVQLQLTIQTVMAVQQA